MFEAHNTFENIPQEYRPDAGEALPPDQQAHVDAMPSMRGGVGRSPDGLSGGAPVQHMPTGGRSHLSGGMGMQHMPTGGAPMGYTGPWEPEDVSPEGAVRSAGVTLLLMTVMTGIGVAAGGVIGGAAGFLSTGGAVNIYRAQKWWGSPDPGEKHEAVTSGLIGAAEVAAGMYAIYKAWEAQRSK